MTLLFLFISWIAVGVTLAASELSINSSQLISSNTTLVNIVEEIANRRKPRHSKHHHRKQVSFEDDSEVEDYYRHHHHPSPAESGVSEIKPRRYIFIEATTTKSTILVSPSLAPPKYTTPKPKKHVVKFKTILGKKSKPSPSLAIESKPPHNSQRNTSKIPLHISASVGDMDEMENNVPESGQSGIYFETEKTVTGAPLSIENFQNFLDNSLGKNVDSEAAKRNINVEGENIRFQNLPIKKQHLEKRSEDGHTFCTSSECLESDSNEIPNEETDDTVIMEKTNLRGKVQNSKKIRTNQAKGNFLSKEKKSLKNETITIVEIITETKDKTRSNDQNNHNFLLILNPFKNVSAQSLDTTKNKSNVGLTRKPETSNVKVSSSSPGSYISPHLQNTNNMQPKFRRTFKGHIISEESLEAKRKTDTIQNVSTNHRILHNFTEHVNLQSKWPDTVKHNTLLTTKTTPKTVKPNIRYTNTNTLINPNRVQSEKSSIFKNESVYKLISKNETRPKLKNNSANNYLSKYPQREQNFQSNLASENENISLLSVRPMKEIGNIQDVFENNSHLENLQQGQYLKSTLPEGFDDQDIVQLNPIKKIGKFQYVFESKFPLETLQGRNLQSTLPEIFPNTKIPQLTTLKPINKIGNIQDVLENSFPLQKFQQTNDFQQRQNFQDGQNFQHDQYLQEGQNFQKRQHLLQRQKLHHSQIPTPKRPGSLGIETIIKLSVPAETKNSESHNLSEDIYSSRNVNPINSTHSNPPGTFKNGKPSKLKIKSESAEEKNDVEDANDYSTSNSKLIQNVQSNRPRAFKKEVITKLIIDTGSNNAKNPKKSTGTYSSENVDQLRNPKSKRPNSLENNENHKVSRKSGIKREKNVSHVVHNRFLKQPELLKSPPSRTFKIEPIAASIVQTKTQRSKIQYDLAENTPENFYPKKLKHKPPVKYVYSKRALTSKLMENKIVSKKEPELEIENSNSEESKKIKTHKKHKHKGHKMLSAEKRRHRHRHKSKNKRKNSRTERKHRKRKKKHARLKDKEKISNKRKKHKEKHGKHKHVKHEDVKMHKRHETESESQENTKNSVKLRIHVHDQNSGLNFRKDYKINKISSSQELLDSSQEKIKALNTNHSKISKKNSKKINSRIHLKKQSRKVQNKIQTSNHTYIKQGESLQNFNDTSDSLQSANNTNVPRFKIRAPKFTNNSAHANVKFRARVPHHLKKNSTLKRSKPVSSTKAAGKKFKNLKQKKLKPKKISVKKKTPQELKTASTKIKFKQSIKLKTKVFDQNFTKAVRTHTENSKKISFKSKSHKAFPKTELNAKIPEFSIGSKSTPQENSYKNVVTFQGSNFPVNLSTIKTHPNKSENIPSPEISVPKTKMSEIRSENASETASTRTVFSVVAPGVEFDRTLSEENNFGLQTPVETSTADSVKTSNSFKSTVSEQFSQIRNGAGKNLGNLYSAKTEHSVSLKSHTESIKTSNETTDIKAKSMVNTMSKEGPTSWNSFNDFTSSQNGSEATNPKTEEARKNVSTKPEIKQNIQITIIFQGGDSNNSKLQTNFNQNGTYNADATILNAILKNVLHAPVAKTQIPVTSRPTGEPGLNTTNLTNEYTMGASSPIQGRGFQFFPRKKIQNSNNVSLAGKFVNASESADLESNTDPAVLDSGALKKNLNSGAQMENLNSGAQMENLNSGAQKENLNSGAQKENLNSGALKENLNSSAQMENLNSGAQKENMTSGAQNGRLKGKGVKMDLKIPASTETPKFSKTTEDYGALHPDNSNSKNETGRHPSKMQELVEAYKRKDFYSKKQTGKKVSGKAKGRSVLPVKHPPTQKPKHNFPPLGRSAGGPKRYRLIDLIEENIKKG